jgi:hypothetical protein
LRRTVVLLFWGRWVFPTRLSRPGTAPVLAGEMFYPAGMSTRYVCDYCGHEGTVPGDEPVDSVQCPMCGEPVTPLD